MSRHRGSAVVYGAFVAGSLLILEGCGGDGGKNQTVQDSPAAQAATSQGIDDMRAAMQGKGKSGKSASKAGPPHLKIHT